MPRVSQELMQLREAIKNTDEEIERLTKEVTLKKIQVEILTGISTYGIIEQTGGKQLLDKLGMKYAQLPADKAELVKRAWVTSLWELADQCCGDGSKELHAIALKAKLTN